MDGTVGSPERVECVSQRPCLLCGDERRRQRFPGTRLSWIVECVSCGIVFSDPQPSDAELQAIYDEHYYEQFGFVEGAHSADQGLARTKRATYARMLASAAPEVRSAGRRLLDVGCGLGFSLLAARDAGFEALGVDPLGPEDPEHHPGRRIIRGTLETFSDPVPFDLVSLIDVIEHVRDPVATLRRAAELLAPGGALLVATNDSSSLGARLLGPRWTHYHRAHLWFFTPRTLARVVELAGLEVVRDVPAQRVYNLEYVASILARSENFEGAAKLARVLLAITPGPLQRLPWPPVREGFVLVARKRTAT
jgi:SAM-dependent methyltransferase